jgi:hypothetical protein
MRPAFLGGRKYGVDRSDDDKKNKHRQFMSDHDGGRSAASLMMISSSMLARTIEKSGSCSTYGVSIHSSSCPDRHFLLPVWLAATYYYSSCSPMYRDSSDPNDPPPQEY